MARQLPTAEVATTRWVTGVTNSRQRYIEGTQAVTEQNNPMARAAANVQRWQQNVSSPETRARWLAGLARTTLAQWKEACRSKGADNLGRGAELARQKMQQFFTRLFPAITTARGAIANMPNGTFEERMARFRTYATSMHNSFAPQGMQMPGG